ncbi:hypothetical protein BSKO_10149 [Bryopsis sp. KO-2023]|nr:hypothetical protein BSKO_10149 [Bryopsis sp. KO-2023]
MSFVSIDASNDTSRPTFFEMVAAERLTPSLKAAVVYSLWVYAQRRRWMRYLLEFEDEVCFFGAVVLEWSSLVSASGSLAESLYGLKRASTEPGSKGGSISSRQRFLSVLFLVVVPYLSNKLAKLGNVSNQSEGRGDMAESQTSGHTVEGSSAHSTLRSCFRRILGILKAVYPWLHLSYEGLDFIYQLKYLVGQTPYFSPWLQLSKLKVVRVSGDDVIQQVRTKETKRWQALNRVRNQPSPEWWKGVKEAFLRLGFFTSDHGRHAIVVLVFAFKALEWWYSTGEEKLQKTRALPVPPPPPPPKPHPDGVGLPEEPDTCPICRKDRQNPAQIVVSGYVFCYRCIFYFVERHKYCPVTRIPASADHIRRLFKGS